MKKIIRLAEKTKKKYKFKSKFLLSPAEDVKLEGRFDSVIIFGNTLFGISPRNFVRIIQNIKPFLRPKAKTLINYKPWLEELIDKTYPTL